MECFSREMKNAEEWQKCCNWKKKKRIHQKSIRTSGLEERVHELERSIEHTQTETLIGKKKKGEKKKRKRTILWDNIK